jgi:hypothetical protein
MKSITKHDILGWYLLYLYRYTCFLNHFNHSHGRRFTVIATALQCLAILGNILFSVHIPVLSGGIELLEEET